MSALGITRTPFRALCRCRCVWIWILRRGPPRTKTPRTNVEASAALNPGFRGSLNPSQNVTAFRQNGHVHCCADRATEPRTPSAFNGPSPGSTVHSLFYAIFFRWNRHAQYATLPTGSAVHHDGTGWKNLHVSPLHGPSRITLGWADTDRDQPGGDAATDSSSDVWVW